MTEPLTQPTAIESLAKILDDAGAEIQFGLRQQGHMPRIEAMLANGADWQAIGQVIGWDGNTAREWYERFETPSALRQEIRDLTAEARQRIESLTKELAEVRQEMEALVHCYGCYDGERTATEHVCYHASNERLTSQLAEVRAERDALRVEKG